MRMFFSILVMVGRDILCKSRSVVEAHCNAADNGIPCAFFIKFPDNFEELVIEIHHDKIQKIVQLAQICRIVITSGYDLFFLGIFKRGEG